MFMYNQIDQVSAFLDKDDGRPMMTDTYQNYIL